MTARARKPASDKAAEIAEPGPDVVGEPAADPTPDPDADQLDTGDEPDTAAAEPDEPSGTEYLNVTAGPIRYDKAGHQVGGGEWTPPVNLDAIGQDARRAGYILPRSAL